ncbi:cytochrome P450 [Melanomma pulvis-pyrius CBS 109.77]|uniref:Cytochrome P450 n=1 Tax=Melanomma pulvis-pyrius CBS 109.77 TaxID=1314802 RepID=A0A6A6XLE0_9PLEO|nr:cytochrome P450 [Melanomma pulvis-pyrius CBS 109.77]
MKAILVIGMLTCAVIYLGLHLLLYATQDKREPRPLGTSIPFLSPIFAVINDKVKYLVKLRDEYQLPIYTLRLPFSRLYIVNKPSLIQAVQRQASALSFGPVGRDFGFLFSGLTKASQDILRKAYDGNGNGFTSIVHQCLKDGPFLHAATRSAINGLALAVPKWGHHGTPLNIFDIVRHTLTMALTDTVYGPQNPFRNPKVEASWLEFLPGISHLMYSPLPSFTARNNLRARGKVITAFNQYFKMGGHLEGSTMIQDMYEANRGHGLNMEECAKMEIATSLALLSSGSITAIWLILHILSDAAVLSAVRKEILDNLATKVVDEKATVITVDVRKTKATCPILMSVLQETMRYHSTVMSAKTVKEDVLLSDTYFLKKGSLLMIPGPVVHHDSAIWGPDVGNFDHRRFLDSKKTTISTSSFRPFGSGSTMCPGRHFSTNAILGMVAMMVLQLDVTPIDFEGKWVLPTTEGADLWNAMPKLDHDIAVRIEPRKEMQDVEMKFVWGDEDGN